MEWRERFLRILEHEEPDRLPLDIWLSPAFAAKLRGQLKQDELTNFSPDLWLGVRSIGPSVSDDFARKGVAYEAFIHYGVGIWVEPSVMEDEWGVRRRLTAAGTESRIIHHPLEKADEDFLDEYPFPDPDAPGRFKITKEDVEKMKEEGYWVVGGVGADAFWCQAWYLRGFKQLMIDLYENPRFVNKLLSKLLEYYVGIGRKLSELGVDQINIYDDVAAQTGLLIAPKLWRKYFKPNYEKLIGALRTRVKYVFYHSDGELRPIIPDLIELGVNILNPVQPDCMNLSELKTEYGDKITLWGGLSVQETLPHGTPERVKEEVKRTIEVCAPGGGFVLGTSNNITQDTPIENFLAIYEAARKYGRYPLKI
ncbi:MAG: uroporphyrinogen decarboxylase family protein [Candidatus Bathyarchaeia archaeon]